MATTTVKLKSETGGVHKFDVEKITEPIVAQIANGGLVPVSAADEKKLQKAGIVGGDPEPTDEPVEESAEES